MSEHPQSVGQDTTGAAGPEADPPEVARKASPPIDRVARIANLAEEWAGKDPTVMAGSLLQVLVETMELDFAGLRFAGSAHTFFVMGESFGQRHHAEALTKVLGDWLDRESREWPASVVFGEDDVPVLAHRLGAVSSVGLLVAGSRRPGYPDASDRLLLTVAASQAALAYREVREASDSRVPAGTSADEPAPPQAQQREGKLSLAINMIPAMAWSTTADGMLDYCNQHYLDYVGLTWDDVKGLGFWSIFHPDDIPQLLHPWQDMMAEKRGGEVQGRIRRADGEFRWNVFRANPLFDEQGNVVKWYGVNTDMEEGKRASDALKATESALRSSERSLSTIINSLPVLVWSARADGSARFVNDEFAKYVGLPHEDLLDWGYWQICHPDDVERMQADWAGQLDADVMTNGGRVRRHDGVYRWCYFAGRKICGPDGEAQWFGVVIDIDDLKSTETALTESEMALKESEGRLNLIINTMPAMAWSAMPDGMLDFWNQYFLDFVGVPFDLIRGEGFYRIFHPDDLEMMRASWEEILVTKNPKEVDGRIRRADGEYRWFTLRQSPLLDAEGNVLKWYGIVIEIEDRKRAELALEEAREALLQSEGRLQQIISSIPGLAWASDKDGATTFWSQQYLDYAGLLSEDVLGFGFLDHIHPDDRPHIMEVWEATIASGKPGEAEARLRRADGIYRWFLIRASPFYDAAGNLTQWFGVNIDIEDRKRAEEELRRSQGDLAHVARVTTIGELAVSIAHEINQPLMAIVTNAGTTLRWLEEGRTNIAEARRAAERVVRDGHRAGDIIASIRMLARKSDAKMVPTDLPKVIYEVLQLLRGELQRRAVEVRLDLPRKPVIVLGDCTQLQQVILNLVMNSAEAMADIPEADRRVTISCGAGDDGLAQVSVADRGRGMAAGDFDKVFEAFFSTKSDGMGMGLAICRSIVEAHGGSIRAANHLPQGTEITFTVPLASGSDSDGQ